MTAEMDRMWNTRLDALAAAAEAAWAVADAAVQTYGRGHQLEKEAFRLACVAQDAKDDAEREYYRLVNY